MTVYRLRSARVAFPGGTTVALPDLEIVPGERVAVLGPNGSGKTTLLRVLGGLERAEGEVVLGACREEIAFVPQRPYFFRRSVAANVALALRNGARGERAGRIGEALDRVGASHLARRRPSGLSAGELHRAALARALVARPRILLLDEPLGPLDDAGAARLRVVLRELRDVTVIAAAPTARGIPFDGGSRTIALPA